MPPRPTTVFSQCTHARLSCAAPVLIRASGYGRLRLRPGRATSSLGTLAVRSSVPASLPLPSFTNMAAPDGARPPQVNLDMIKNFAAEVKKARRTLHSTPHVLLYCRGCRALCKSRSGGPQRGLLRCSDATCVWRRANLRGAWRLQLVHLLTVLIPTAARADCSRTRCRSWSSPPCPTCTSSSARRVAVPAPRVARLLARCTAGVLPDA